MVRRLHSDFVTASRIEEYSSILRHAREAGYALISLDVFLADDAAVKIAPQIGERFLAAADRFAINHPGARVARRQRQARRFDAGQHLRPKHLRQCLVVEQIACLCLAAALGAPTLPVTVDSGRRHDQMDMGVIVQPARVRVQHRDGARCSLKLPVVAAEGVHALPGATDQKIVDSLLMRPGQRRGNVDPAVRGVRPAGERCLHSREQPREDNQARHPGEQQPSGLAEPGPGPERKAAGDFRECCADEIRDRAHEWSCR